MAYVALDYGHGRNTFPPSKGTYHKGKGYHEHDFNADVGEQVRVILEDHGVKVLVTQPPNQNDVGLDYRTNLANRKNVDLFVSIHANAGVPSAKGACVFAWKGYSGSNKAADLVVKHFKKAGIDLHGNGRHYSQFGSWTNFHVLRKTDMSAILIEHGFMTNSSDFENIFGRNSKEYRRKCAIADAKAILEFFGIGYKNKVEKASHNQEEINLANTGFKDVEKGSTLQKEITKAKGLGITKGVGNDLFKPDQSVTRAESVAFAVRAYEKAFEDAKQYFGNTK